ncbi:MULTISPECIES: AEC family transporter [Cyanophyceae]|uniref:AEC family transporter n=1 Tax=Cyanophyceae TaxID=3028117 RepID=UPI001687A975|nr:MULTISPECIES: AEC family transporter [Cyanophyceae]MBD1917324.1 AEC family transporter [Phormidium sp. FACHB-77]MBD2032247.1 AEC family transporter [Phormidium sp. FACHB-322]MBD2053285.1 AEC family transporter [Leptolyngbya sp. FACHB-60]
MRNSLIQAYLPLIIWVGLGAGPGRFLPAALPRLMGRGLYWVGIPLEIFALARQTHFAEDTGLAPLYTVVSLGLGLGLGLAGLAVVRSLTAPTPVEATATEVGVVLGLEVLSPQAVDLPLWPDTATMTWADKPRQGSFVLAAMLGNTGFVGLAIVPTLVSGPYLGWAVFYSVTQNVVGTYGLGVFLASWFGRGTHAQSRWQQLRDVVTVPSLWAFGLGSISQAWAWPPQIEDALHQSVWLVIPVALVLMGLRLSQLQGWSSLQPALIPAMLKVLVLPAMVGAVALGAGLPRDAVLVLVLMSGMPSAFAGLILAEEYDLDRELAAASIALSTGGLLLTIPLWLLVFG